MSKNIENFVFAHQLNVAQKSQKLELAGAIYWETCLRKFIFFENPQTIPLDDLRALGFEIYQGSEAVIFFIEVLCGLHSRIFGENEIFGQFKKFQADGKLSELPFFRNQEFLSFIYTTTKTIRSENFINSGVNSYGSYLRKACKDFNEISIIGKGQLSQKLQSWLQEKDVRLHGRHPESFASTLVIAAPVDTEVLQKWMEDFGSNVERIYDFRALDGQKFSLRRFWQKELIELSEVFSKLEIHQDEKKQKMSSVQKQIASFVQAWQLKAQHRPQGWDDLCT